MIKYLPLAKKSAKEVFINLRKNWPYFCKIFDKEIFVWREFFWHIFFKKREKNELMKRFFVFPFIEKIIKDGFKVGAKNNNFKKISLNDWDYKFTVVILEKNNKLNLLSCFVEYKKNKNLS